MFVIGYIVGFVVAVAICTAVNQAATAAPHDEPDWDRMSLGDADRFAKSEELTWHS